MSLQNPQGLWLLALAVPLLLLYWLRTPHAPRVVPSLRLFQASVRSSRAANQLRPRRPELSLLLQLLALLLLALQVSGLRFGHAEPQRYALALVLDVSASMAASARAGSRESRLDQAKEAARALLRNHQAERVRVVLAGHEPQLLAGDTAHLLAQLREVEAEDNRADLRAAVALAEQQVRGASEQRVWVLSDVNSDYQTHKPHVRVMRTGEPLDNWAILHARASWTRALAPAASVTSRPGARLQISAQVASFATQPRALQISLHALLSEQGDTLDAQTPPLDRRELTLEPGAKKTLQFTLNPGDLHGAYELRLAGADALLRDDRAVVVPPRSPQLPVALIAAAGSASAQAIGRALAADDSLSLQWLTFAQYERAHLDDDTFEIWVGQCPTAPRGRDLLVFAPAPGRCFEVYVDPPSETLRTLDGFRSDDPRMRFLSLDDVHVQHASTLRASSGQRALAEDRHGALIVDASTAARRRTIAGFAPEHSDFPARRSFVLFLRNLTELAANQRQGFGQASLAAGQSAALALGGDDRVVQLLTPDGLQREAEVQRGELLLAPQPRAGLLRLRWSEPTPRTAALAIDYADPRESDLRSAVAGASAHEIEPPEARELTARSWAALWHEHSPRLLALLVLCILLLELAVYIQPQRMRSP